MLAKAGSIALLGLVVSSPQPAHAGDPAPPASSIESAPNYVTVVTATTPLHGSRLPREQVPANVQVLSAEDLAEHHSLDLSAYMSEALGSVHLNEVQGNPLQADLQYRGFLASPLLGAPQGLSIYLDGVRLNEPFGDTMNWDLIPANAIRSVNVVPGSNPVFGLNTLGGALSLETKNGFSDPGVEGTLLYGSWGRKLARASAGAHGGKFGAFIAAQVLDETGWRDFSPSRAQHAFVSASYQGAATTADLSLIGANTTLVGNGTSPEQLLAMNRRAVFTAPDRTENQLFMATLRGDRSLAPRLRLAGVAYLRTDGTHSINGDQRDWAECSASPGVLCSSDGGGAETPVLDRLGMPVPFAASFNAAVNRIDTRQTSYGATAQLAADAPVLARENHLFVGADAGQSRIRFRSQSTVATLDDARRTIDAGFLDLLSPIAVDSVVSDLGIYASDTFSLRTDLFLVLSGRVNLTSVSLEDRLGAELSSDHGFRHVNPAGGLSYQPRRWLGAYASLSESNRAPTAVELTCASPVAPCRLPNAFAADPPLAQVVARTFETGVRGAWRVSSINLSYDLAAFRTVSSNDILFITSGMVANQGYFANVGQTRRQGLEAGLSGRRKALAPGGRIEWALHYTLTDATFESPFAALSATHPDAVNGRIDVPAGARIPSIPRHIGKVALSCVSSSGLSAGLNAVAYSSQYLRGDEANLLAPVPGYVVLNGRVAYRFWSHASAFVSVNNILDTRYSTFGVLGDATAVLGPTYGSPRFASPGAPRAAWVGLDLN